MLIGALDAHDPHHATARALFTRWRADQDAPTISVVNLSEVLVAPSRTPAGLADAREAIAALRAARQERIAAVGD